jgi:hypothetical protein
MLRPVHHVDMADFITLHPGPRLLARKMHGPWGQLCMVLVDRAWTGHVRQVTAMLGRKSLGTGMCLSISALQHIEKDALFKNREVLTFGQHRET